MRSHIYMRIWQVLDCWTSANVKDYRFSIHDVKVHKETDRYMDYLSVMKEIGDGLWTAILRCTCFGLDLSQYLKTVHSIHQTEMTKILGGGKTRSVPQLV